LRLAVFHGPRLAITWNSIGIVDEQSMLNMTDEAWIRNPVTIIESVTA
jgi:hypothetical protein